MATLAELTVQLMTARLAKRDLSFDELQKEMDYFSSKLKSIDAGCTVTQEPVPQETSAPVVPDEPAPPVKINMKKVFRDDKVVCLECSKEFGSLNRHLQLTHSMTDKEYKLKYNIPAKQKLVAKSVSEKARQSALDRNQGAVMAKGRADKKVAKAEATVLTE